MTKHGACLSSFYSFDNDNSAPDVKIHLRRQHLMLNFTYIPRGEGKGTFLVSVSPSSNLTLASNPPRPPNLNKRICPLKMNNVYIIYIIYISIHNMYIYIYMMSTNTKATYSSNQKSSHKIFQLMRSLNIGRALQKQYIYIYI